MKFPTFTGERRAGKQMQRHASFKEIVSRERERERESGEGGSRLMIRGLGEQSRRKTTRDVHVNMYHKMLCFL